MKKKPLFITAIIALAVIGIVAVVLFLKNEPKGNKKNKPEPEQEEPEEDKNADFQEAVIITD